MIDWISPSPNCGLAVRFVAFCFIRFVVLALVETADSTKNCSYIESAVPLIRVSMGSITFQAVIVLWNFASKHPLEFPLTFVSSALLFFLFLTLGTLLRLREAQLFCFQVIANSSTKKELSGTSTSIEAGGDFYLPPRRIEFPLIRFPTQRPSHG